MDGRDRRRFNRRVHLVVLVLLFGLGAAGVRSFRLQTEQHERMARLAREQYLNDVRLPARRGRILDRHGKPLAVSVDVPSVYANPSAVVDARKTARALAPVLGADLHVLYQRLASERLFVWLKRQVSPEVARKVEALKLPGIATTKEPKRFYPNREVAAHSIGFTGVDGQGLEGIERSLDEELTGEPQVVMVERDGRGRAVLSSTLDPEHRTSGQDVYLTLDLQVQHAAEQALRRAVTATQARAGTAVVLDVPTGEVLAIAVQPQYNANLAGDVPAARRRNRAITDVFEPGSTMKPLVVAAALQTKAVQLDEVFFCENGALTIGKNTIRDTSQHGWLGLTGIIEKSSNIGAAKVGQALGRERMERYLRAWGFGTRTGVGFPGEVAGLLRPSKTWSDVGLATIAFGHGVAVTSLQMAAAYRALAAGGEWRAPLLVKRNDGNRRGTRRVVSKEVARAVTRMLVAAASPEGTGAAARVPGYTVAGKTGTAQKIDPVTGGYSSDKFVAAFAGFAPADDPRIVIVVSVDEPHHHHTGGSVAAPVFSEIAAATLRYLGVVPEITVANEAPSAKVQPEELAEQPVQLPVTSQSDTALGDAEAVPSFLGLTARQVMERYVEVGRGLELVLLGSGRVVRQDPKPGSLRRDIRRIELTMAD